MTDLLTLDDLDLAGLRGRRVFVRVDFNVPLSSSGEVLDDTRLREALPTLRELTAAGGKLLLASHSGRPKGAPDPKYSLKPVAAKLAELLGRPVRFAEDCIGEPAEKAASELAPGEVALLENLRFNAGETSKDDAERAEFARCLALLTGGEDDGGAFVEDAFGAVHRKHASVYDVATLLPHYTGDLVRDELEVLQRLTGNAERPYAVVLGGSKVSDKLAVIQSLLP
jgi:phosphoglycerate kinase